VNNKCITEYEAHKLNITIELIFTLNFDFSIEDY